MKEGRKKRGTEGRKMKEGRIEVLGRKVDEGRQMKKDDEKKERR
jgi:hypothetical protein